jgi:hypothetical protein
MVLALLAQQTKNSLFILFHVTVFWQEKPVAGCGAASTWGWAWGWFWL